MLTAPPDDGVCDEEAGGSVRRKLSLPATELDEPPPFQVDNKGEEPGWCSRRVSLMPCSKCSWLRPAEDREEEGSDRRAGERGGALLREMGGRSEL